MFSASVHTGKWLFVKKTYKTMLCSNFLHDFHCELVMIGCNISSCVDWRQLMLCRCNFIMFCFCENSKLPKFFVEFFHICGYTRFDHAEVVIVHLLALGRFRPEEGSAGK